MTEYPFLDEWSLLMVFYVKGPLGEEQEASSGLSRVNCGFLRIGFYNLVWGVLFLLKGFVAALLNIKTIFWW